MDPQKQLTFYKLSLIIPSIFLIVGIITAYFNWEFFSGRFLGNGLAFLGGFIVILSVLLGLPFLIYRKSISKNSIKGFLVGLHSIFSVIGIAVIVVGSNLSFIYIAADFNTGPVLTWATGQDPTSEITVMWQTSKSGPSVVYYGTDPSSLELTASVPDEVDWHRVPLIGLTPHTEYFYRVEGLSERNVNSFVTAPFGESDFTFLLFSDPRQNTSPLSIALMPNIPKLMMRTMNKQGTRPAFTINCGDTTTFAPVKASWRSFFNDISRSGLASNAPIQVAIGNHEREYNHTGEIFASYYPYTGHPEYYYSYNYSSVHVQVLDPWNFTIGGYWAEFSPAQLSWIEKDLQNAQSMKYRIIALHPPPVYNNNTAIDMYQPLVDLCEIYGVNAVFYGHAHSFAVNKINDTNYFLIGVGGNFRIGPSGFVQVDVTSTEMQVNMHWTNGTRQSLATITAV